jgi:hypothetical protein
MGWSQWPCGLKHELSSLARTLGSWVRIPLEVWMSSCAFIPVRYELNFYILFTWNSVLKGLKVISWMLELRLIKLHQNIWMKSLQFLNQLVRIDYISEKWSIEASGSDGMQYDFVSECNSSLMSTCGTQIDKLNPFRRSRRASTVERSSGP